MIEKEHWAYKDDIKDDGPACYELGICHPAGRIRSIYVGHATNLRSRMHSHAIGDKTTDWFMAKSVSNGFEVWFRFYRLSTTKGGREDGRELDAQVLVAVPWSKIGLPWHPSIFRGEP